MCVVAGRLEEGEVEDAEGDDSDVSEEDQRLTSHRDEYTIAIKSVLEAYSGQRREASKPVLVRLILKFVGMY
ncbi:hypothetical protein RJT34_03744 [Clitoria ternatea]|uniref:Uncharacterized protein n=1 Tax=Clitoria ternatea TaxID=43366 RepID=A0AAN9KJZ5_CLITE